ncbi:MAG: hypothetical protein OXR84_12525 [Magnetovibrio sp.]|nr:hypothetical protein [Magnetovibrio sp.]
MSLKYIVLDAPGGAAPVVFPRSFYHAYVAGLFPGMAVLGAGFVELGDRVRCYGTSTSLRIDSRGEVDSELIRELGAAGRAAMPGDV